MNKPLAIAFIVTAGPTLAQCPNGPLGPEGLKLTRDNPFMEVIYRPSPEGVIEQRQQERDGVMQTKTSIYPHPLMIGKYIFEEGELAFKYDQPVSDLEKLDQTKVWESKAQLLIGDVVIDEGVAHAQFKAVETISIGACDYKVWVVEDYTDLTESGKTVFAHFYSPDLGVILQVISLDENSKPVSMVAFDRIETP